jgi:4-amino-4-deoxy-L-arabinose transferase-like glycosyltransferase
MQSLSARHRRVLFAIISLGMVLRAALFLCAWHYAPDLSRLHQGDSITYIEPADSLLHEGRFDLFGRSEIFRTPGYSLLLIPGVALHQVELVTFCLQLILSLATIWLVHQTTFELFDNSTAALGAALLMAIEPLAIIYTSAILTETLFTFLFVLFLRHLLRYLRNDSSSDLLVGALVLAAATFVRPVTYYLTFVLIAGLLVRSLWLNQRWRHLAQCGAFAVACLAPLVAWQVRNHRVAEYTAFTASGDFNLFYHQAAWAVAHRQGQTIQEVQKQFAIYDDEGLAELYPELRGASRAQRFSFMGREGKRIIRLYWSDWIKAQINNVIMIAANPAATNFLLLAVEEPEPRLDRPAGAGILGTIRQMARETPALLRASIALASCLVVTYLLSFIGLISSLRRRPVEMLVLVGISAYLMAVSSGVVEARMRHPVMPMLCLAGGAGIAAIGRVLAWRPLRSRETLGSAKMTRGLEALAPSRAA